MWVYDRWFDPNINIIDYRNDYTCRVKGLDEIFRMLPFEKFNSPLSPMAH